MDSWSQASVLYAFLEPGLSALGAWYPASVLYAFLEPGLGVICVPRTRPQCYMRS